jgi:AP-4 complex subunit epsilon-1
MPDALKSFAENGTPTPVFEEGPIKVGVISGRGAVLLGIINGGDAPIIGVKAAVIGPDALVKEVASHPKALRAIPPQQAVWLLTAFKFPQQMKGFPEFKFTASIQYGVGKPITIALGDVNLATFIVPATATTQQFSGFWKGGGKEEVYILPSTAGVSLDELSQALNEIVHVKTVQRIGSEEIFIGTLYSTPLKILIHARFSAAKVDVKVLTKAPPLTQAIVALLKSILG